MKIDIDKITYNLLQNIESKLHYLDFETKCKIKIFEEEKTCTVSHILWLLIQHQDHDVAFQKEMMDKYGDMFSLTDKAYLEDRIRVNTSQPQIYVTQ